MFAVSVPEISDFGENQDRSVVKRLYVVLLDANVPNLGQHK